MQTLNQHIKLFSDFATAHKQINAFDFGDPWEFNVKNGTWQNPDKCYPAMLVVCTGSTVSGNEITDNYDFIFCDLVHKDESDENEVLSDQKLIALDFLAFLAKADIGQQDLIKSSSLADFTERFTDEVSGWIASVSIKQHFSYNECEIPMTSAPSTGDECLGVTILNSVGGVITVIESGGFWTDNTSGGCDSISITNSSGTYNQVITCAQSPFPLPNETYNIYLDGVLNQSLSLPTLGNNTINISL